MHNPWKTLGHRWIYTNPWLQVREDEVVRPDGTIGIYSVVVMRPSVGIVALDSSRNVALVEQWRYTLGRPSLEIPTGGSEESDEGLEQAARRELLEETGLSNGYWSPLGTVDNSNGVTNEVAHLFLVDEVIQSAVAQQGQLDEPVSVVWTPFEQAVAWAAYGSITESISVAALLRADHHLRNTKSL